MRIGTLAFAASAMLLIGTAASASGGKAQAGPGLDASGAIAGRQAGMRMSGALMGAIKGGIDRGDDVKTFAFAARSLAGWAKAVPGMFPEGSGVAPSNALPVVWSDRAGFEAKAAAYATEAGKLADLAKASDTAGFAAQWAVVRASCNACHDVYKKPDQH